MTSWLSGPSIISILLTQVYDKMYLGAFEITFYMHTTISYYITLFSVCQQYFCHKIWGENVKFFCNIFSKKIFNIVYLLFIIYNDIIRLQLQLFLSSFLKKCIEKRLSSGSHFLYAPLSFILLIFPFH